MKNLENSLWQSKKFVMAWQITLGLFCLSIFTSKSGLQIFGVLLALLAMAGLDWKTFFTKEKIAAGLFLLYPLVIICGFFSVAEAAGALRAAAAWPWTLLVLPTLLIMERPKDIRLAKCCFVIGLSIACGKCFYNYSIGDLVFSGDGAIRVASFWDVSRWGLFCGVAFVLLTAKLIQIVEGKLLFSKKGASVLLLMAAVFACLILSNNRGPWLACGVSFVVFFLLYPRSWKILLFFLLIAGIVFSFSKSLQGRLSSIASVQSDQNGFTSKDPSNSGRLNMWKVALDFYKEQPFFGTGIDNTEVPLKNFLSRQSEDYRQKYTTMQYSYRDQHSSPLSMLVQMGFVFSLAFWGMVAISFFNIFRRWYQTRSLLDVTLISGIVFHLVLCLVYTSFMSFEIVSFIPLLVIKRGEYGDT